MEYETHAYGIEFDSKTFLKSEMKKQKFILKTDFNMKQNLNSFLILN